eukprot:TRINITY_DN1620_c0_g1_i4.p1 TRINITY_DN1620_c0_g1~~TRINITY_DN1620_c0_g1_i4.p1  ORF type:complete len:521 (-),score=108.40 TRINITY_DN1620_c0_g1_i4:49-1566(-)
MCIRDRYMGIVILFAITLATNIKVCKKTRHYVDSNNKIRVFHGVNVVYKKKPYHPDYQSRFHPLYSFNKEDIEKLKVWGQNVIRLFVSWEATEPARGKYNMTYINAIKEIVEMCAKEDIFVILDAHQDVLSPYFCGEGLPKWAVHIENFPYPADYQLRRDENGIPLEEDCLKRPFWKYYFTDDVHNSFKNLYENKNGIRDSFGDFWKMVAENFRNYPNVIGYEIINEPFIGSIKNEPEAIFYPGLADRKYLYPFYQIIHKRIREADNQKIIFFDNYEFDELAVGFTESPEGPEYNDRQAFSIHLYCPLLDDKGEPKYEMACDFIHSAHYRMKTKAAEKMGTGVFLTEFGSMASTDKGLREIDHVLKKADAAFMSWAYWQFKFFHDVTSTTRPAINEGFYDSVGHLQSRKVKLLSRPYLPEICGTPVSAEYDSKKAYAKFEYTAGECSDNTTVLYVNEGLFNDGNKNTIQVLEGVQISSIKPNYFALTHKKEHVGKKVVIIVKARD